MKRLTILLVVLGCCLAAAEPPNTLKELRNAVVEKETPAADTPTERSRAARLLGLAVSESGQPASEEVTKKIIDAYAYLAKLPPTATDQQKEMFFLFQVRTWVWENVKRAAEMKAQVDLLGSDAGKLLSAPPNLGKRLPPKPSTPNGDPR